MKTKAKTNTKTNRRPTRDKTRPDKTRNDFATDETSALYKKTDGPLSNPVEPSTHVPGNIWQAATIFIAHINNWRLCIRWLLKPSWPRHSGRRRCSAPCKLPQCSGSSVVAVVLLFDDCCYGLQLGRPLIRHADGLHCVRSPLHSVTPALWQDNDRGLLQLFVAHVGLDATKHVLRVFLEASNPATSDLFKLMH